jgi:hypothetical protein
LEYQRDIAENLELSHPVCCILQVDISAHVAYAMASKEDSELNHIKVRKLYDLVIILFFSYIFHYGSSLFVWILLIKPGQIPVNNWLNF